MMGCTDFSPALLDDLTARAERSPRRRAHRNVHATYADPVQRLFNAVCVDSYIRPHRHLLDPKHELLMAVRGRFGLILFNDDGGVTGTLVLSASGNGSPAAELAPEQWHTAVALEPGSILFEIKPGPFDPLLAKEPAPWSPEEATPEAAAYHARLRSIVPSF
jgi:cupin fold WbuC family metalloprotein